MITKLLSALWVLACVVLTFSLSSVIVSVLHHEPAAAIPAAIFALSALVVVVLVSPYARLGSIAVALVGLLCVTTVAASVIGFKASYQKEGKLLPVWSQETKEALWLSEVRDVYQLMVEVDTFASDSDSAVRAQLSKLEDYRSQLSALTQKYASTEASALPSPVLLPLASQLVLALDSEYQFIDKRIIQLSTADSVTDEELKAILTTHRDERAKLPELLTLATSNLGLDKVS